VDFDTLRQAIEARLPEAPRFLQKLRWVPFEGHPVWVDDREFNLDYHVRHTSLPRPGSPEQLRRLAARVQAQRLDRARPLWDLWVVEGLAGGRFALITRVHDALLEGVETDLLQVLLSPDPARRATPGPAHRPRPAPSAAELVLDELLRQARLPRRVLANAHERWQRREHLPEELARRMQRAARLLGYSLGGAPETPLTGPLGPHRRFDHLVLPLADARRVRKALGGSIHDVLLTTLCGAIARYFRAHYLNPATLDFRAAVPVALREGGAEEDMAVWVLELPLWETDPLRCYERICERTAAEQRERPALEAEQLVGARHWSATSLLTRADRAMAEGPSVGVRVVNVPGPQRPLYLEGARLTECFGKVPLDPRGGLGIAILSYDGRLCFGLNADFDGVPDLPRLTDAIRESFEALVSAATRPRGALEIVRALAP
jgi:diacylglycerol O-acyltransferase / wax synthase